MKRRAIGTPQRRDHASFSYSPAGRKRIRRAKAAAHARHLLGSLRLGSRHALNELPRMMGSSLRGNKIAGLLRAGHSLASASFSPWTYSADTSSTLVAFTFVPSQLLAGSESASPTRPVAWLLENLSANEAKSACVSPSGPRPTSRSTGRIHISDLRCPRKLSLAISSRSIHLRHKPSSSCEVSLTLLPGTRSTLQFEPALRARWA